MRLQMSTWQPQNKKLLLTIVQNLIVFVDVQKFSKGAKRDMSFETTREKSLKMLSNIFFNFKTAQGARKTCVSTQAPYDG